MFSSEPPPSLFCPPKPKQVLEALIVCNSLSPSHQIFTNTTSISIVILSLLHSFSHMLLHTK